ncbi:hypothetical protein FIA58_004880 [Flavobacterium jejuense]|uniref:C1q domain-containing protein n=1 Tax=Flavobacterium jejuense TaxID=1544455 RepID=A0ABX0IMI0_9FLAO|nr:hypothetical protein [Flavobacterium jejuense]NHN25007.1 hypothetical protein [Flavobacterium jejuense]
MNPKKIVLLLLVFPFLIFSQVGIGTTNPTKELDVNGDVRIRGLSNNSGTTNPVSVTADGTLVTSLNNVTAPGIKFVGFLSSDLSLNLDFTFKDIVLSNELLDVLNEYNTTTGRYSPSIDGYYKISMDFDIGNYTNSSNDLDILIGLWDFTANKWVLRRTFKHRDNNNSGLGSGRNESYGITNYLQLLQSHSYGFRIFTDYEANTNRDAKLKSHNTGSTGTSLSTNFSIEKVL